MQNECELEFISHCAFGLDQMDTEGNYWQSLGGPLVVPCYTEMSVSCSYLYFECNVLFMHNVSNIILIHMLNVMLSLHAS